MNFISGGISKGYKTAWYDPNSHVYTIQNYGNGTSFGHIQLKIDSEYKKFIGIEYVNNSEASHTLFSDDFEIKIDQDFVSDTLVISSNNTLDISNQSFFTNVGSMEFGIIVNRFKVSVCICCDISPKIHTECLNRSTGR